MLVATEIYQLTAIIPPVFVLGPAIAGIVWIRRHADWYRGLSALRQLLAVFVLVGWMVFAIVLYGNSGQWFDKANLWIIREVKARIMKEDLTLIGSTEYRLADGRAVTLRAADARYIVVNDSPRTIRRTNVLYGQCTPNSIHTLSAGMTMEPELYILPGTVNTVSALGYFGDSLDRPPQEITTTRLRGDMDAPCEWHFWYAPADSMTPGTQGR